MKLAQVLRYNKDKRYFIVYLDGTLMKIVQYKVKRKTNFNKYKKTKFDLVIHQF